MAWRPRAFTLVLGPSSIAALPADWGLEPTAEALPAPRANARAEPGFVPPRAKSVGWAGESSTRES